MAKSRILNMSTGPVEVSRAVLDAQLIPILTPHLGSFWELHDQTIALLKRILRTSSEVVLTHGSIRSGLDVALGNFVTTGFKVLCLENGFWGRMLGDWAESWGAQVTRLSFDELCPVDTDAVAELLKEERFDMVMIVHVETNAGIVNPVARVGELLKKSKTLYFVDTACSAGALPVETDLWGIDIGVTGSHKCLASVPGLAIITLSEKALSLLSEGRMGNYYNLKALIKNTIERPVTPPFTQAASLVHALNQALTEIDAFGIENWWAYHHQVAANFRQSLKQAGFRVLLDDGPVSGDETYYSDSVIAIGYPDGVDDAKFRETLMCEHGMFVIGNVGRYAGKSFRVGLMSPPQLEAINLSGALAVLVASAKSVNQNREGNQE